MIRLETHSAPAVLTAVLMLMNDGAQAAGPAIAVVTDPAAPALEKFAATELAGLLQKLFDARVEITGTAKSADNVILLGNPKTNPAAKALLGNGAPKLSAQGHFLKSVGKNGQSALIVGGGSPAATLWAVYELGYHFGMRSLLHADFPPTDRPAFSLAGISRVSEPNLDIRAWRVLAPSPAGPESWSLTDHQQRLRQLAKLKFNRIVLSLETWQPFVHFEHRGIAKQTGVLWHGNSFPVDGETAGRAAFGRDRIFQNPDLRDAKTYAARVLAGTRLINGIIKSAHDLGMTVAIEIAPREFPKEFAAILPNAKPVPGSGALAVHSADRRPRRQALEEAQKAAYQKTYPDADVWILKTSESPGSLLKSHLSSGEAADQCELVYLGNPTGGVLPEFHHERLHQAVAKIRRQKRDGIIAAGWLPDDLNSSAHFLSRTAFDSRMTPARALDELVTPICGKGVGARIAIGFQRVADAADEIERNNRRIATLAPDVIMRHYASAEPVPEWWASTKTAFIEAMNEMYRGNTRARGGARAFSLYHAKRFEFALHYFTCLEETRQAGIAKAAKDKDGQLEHLDKAVEAMHNALGAMADVDRNNGDRGIIAALNKYGFRPLMKELERAE